MEATLALFDRAFAIMKANPGLFCLAGGAALWLYTNRPTSWFPSDIDLFAIRNLKSHEYISLALPVGSKAIHLDTCCYVTPPDIFSITTRDGVIQLVFRRQASTVTQLLLSFDLEVCRVGYTTPEQCVCVWDATSTFSATSDAKVSRLEKYKARGYEHTLVQDINGFTKEFGWYNKKDRWGFTFTDQEFADESNLDTYNPTPGRLYAYLHYRWWDV